MTPVCGLVVDGSAALRERVEDGLTVVPVRIRLGGEDYIDAGDVSQYGRFYERLRAGDVPITSTPSPGEYLAAYQRNPASRLVCLTLPARWSGMHGAATVAAGLLEQQEGVRRVTVVETETAAMTLALVARVAARLVAAGSDDRSVIGAVRRAEGAVRAYGSLATLTYVARSGRVPALVAGISNTLHVRPVFRMQRGETGRVALSRTTNGVLDALAKAAGDLAADPQRVLLFHADAEAEARRLGERLEMVLPIEGCEQIALSPIAGAYTGPGAFGFAALPANLTAA